MITNGFTYIAVLLFITGILVMLPKIFTGKIAQKFFNFAAPIVLMYLGFMVLCTLKVWDLESTASTYSALKNPILYAMLFIMLLRCDFKKIIKLGPKMLVGFFAATFSIAIGFVVSYAIFGRWLGDGAYNALGALCGSWMGGTGNMLAIQEALHVQEADMVFALVMDSICGAFYIMFLLWAVTKAPQFNKWTKANTKAIDEVGAALEEAAKTDNRKLCWQNIMILLGAGFLVSAVTTKLGALINSFAPFLDKATWTVLIVTALGVILAMTPFGKIKGTEEVSNTMLYVVVALIASRADLSGVATAPIWLLCGLVILLIHIGLMLVLAKLMKLDVFTCAVASLANIGGTASAPVLAASYSDALVPVGIVMALLGYVVGTGGGLIVAKAMEIVSTLF